MNFLVEFFGRNSLGGFFWEDFLGGFFGRIIGRIFWEEFFVYIGIDLFVKIWFLSRFWGNERKEIEFAILRSAIAITSHLKRQESITLEPGKIWN